MRTSDRAAEADGAERASLIGRILRDRRERKGFTVEDVAVAIKFGHGHVLAVEEGRFGDLPPQPYARGLVSAYAQFVGVEPEEILRVCGPAFFGRRPGRLFAYPEGERFVWREWTVPFALAAAVVSFVVARIAFLPPAVELSATAPALAPPRPVQQAAASLELPPAAGEASAAPVAVPGLRVLLRCEGTTWAEASADGAEMRRYELGPGQSLEITARERLALSLGDAGVIRIRVNTRELGFIGYKGETKIGLSFAAPKAPPADAASGAGGD